MNYSELYDRLSENIVGNWAICYHRTSLKGPKYKSPKDADLHWKDVINDNPILKSWSSDDPKLDEFKKWGFRSGGGACYGRGFYSAFNLNTANSFTRSYGDLMLKFKASNLQNYLFVDWNEFKKTSRYTENSKRYDENNYIFVQLLDAGVPIENISKLHEACGEDLANKDIANMYGRAQFACDFSPYFEGFVYTGGHNDGDVLVTFDLSWIANNLLRSENINPASVNQVFDDDEDADSYIAPKNRVFSLFNAVQHYQQTPFISKQKKRDRKLKAIADGTYNNKPVAFEPKFPREAINNLLANFNNIKSILPLEFSVDDGAHWHPIPVSPRIKQIIYNLSNAYQTNIVKISSSYVIPDKILEAYTHDNEFTIPMDFLSTNKISYEAVETYVKSHQFKLQIMMKQSKLYYDFVDKLSKFVTSVILSTPGNSDTLVITPELMEFADTFKKKNMTIDIQSRISAVEIESSSNIDSLSVFSFSNNNISLSIIGKDIKLSSEYTCDSITKVIFNDSIGDQDIPILQKCFKNINSIVSYNDKKEKDTCDLKTGLVEINNGIQSFRYLEKYIIYGVKYISLGQIFANRLFSEDSISALHSITSSNIKVAIQRILLSPVKDDMVGREKSCFLESGNLGISSMSLIGHWHIIPETGKTIIGELAIDYESFLALHNGITMPKLFNEGSTRKESSMGIFFPDNEDPKNRYVINDTLIDMVKGMCKNSYFFFRGATYGRDLQFMIDGKHISHDNLVFFSKHLKNYTEKSFSKYLDILKSTK